MNWVKGFTYIFEDKNWFGKMFVGSLVTSVPVVEAITNGYQMQVIENLRTGNARPLPEWRNMDKMFGRGFKLWLAVNLFYVPSIIISVLSWILGIPFLLSLISDLFAAAIMTDNYTQIVSLIFGILLKKGILAIAIFLGSILLPVVFVFVPVMAVRCQETSSLAATLNFYAHVKFVLKHLGDYVVARVLIAVMIGGMHIFASAIGGATVWIAGLGFLLGWFLIAAGRFWSRLAWAYFLANMRMNEQPSKVGFQIKHEQPNLPTGMAFLAAK